MAATTTPSISLLVSKLRTKYPDYIFSEGSPCRWSPVEQTVYFEPINSQLAVSLLLHEVAHACLGHIDFDRDIELLNKERAAWRYAVELAPSFKLVIDPEIIDTHLDTYRDWLHTRSNCPNCQQTGLQTKKKTYSCINCRSSWRVNDARQCQQRRWKLVA